MDRKTFNKFIESKANDVQNSSRNGSYRNDASNDANSVQPCTTLEEDEHLGYDAEIQYKRKPPAMRLIMCTRLDTVRVGEPVMIQYHSGMRCYQHSRHVSTSNDDNCIGGFYYTDGTPA